MFTDAFNHHPGQLLLFSGTTQFGRPTMGAWVIYGLGSESQNLPGFVVLSSGVGTSGGTDNWASGFLPSTYQGVTVPQLGRSDPVPFESDGCDARDASARGLDALRGSERGASTPTPATWRSRRASRRMSWRSACRCAAPDLLDFSQGVGRDARKMYGVDEEPTQAVRHQLPAGAAAGGARRALRDAQHASWDDHTQSELEAQEELRHHRPADRGADQGSEAARAAGFDAGGLGRRVRPHADGGDPQSERCRQRRPRPSSAGLQHVAGRRRHQGRARWWARPTSSC